MGDQFEKFIQENRSHFEVDPNSDPLWNRIEKDLDKRPFVNWNVVWKVAAVLLLMSTLYLSIDRISDTEVEQQSGVYGEFQEAEKYYTSLITEKRQEIDRLVSDELREEFVAELDQLDGLYDDLKYTFDETTANEKVIEAMISNLQLRIDILNQQLSILKRLNEKDNETDNSVEI